MASPRSDDRNGTVSLNQAKIIGAPRMTGRIPSRLRGEGVSSARDAVAERASAGRNDWS
jgi:hypothetical protein